MRLLTQLAVPVTFCLLLGCQKPTITIEVLANGKLMTYVPKGTTVQWVDENNQPLAVKFPFANPCGQGSTDTTCIVENGQAIYECQNNACEDPGIGVVPTTKGSPLAPVHPNVGPAKLYEVFCDKSGNATADGPPVNFNDHVSWVPSEDKSYTLTHFNPENACNPSTISRGMVCVVGINTTVDATYQVQYDVCTGNKTGTGKLHIQQH